MTIKPEYDHHYHVYNVVLNNGVNRAGGTENTSAPVSRT